MAHESKPNVDAPDRPGLWVIRHGETEWASLGRHTSRTDVPLLEVGERDARRLGALLRGHRFAEVLSSPLHRALDTCRLAGFGDRAELAEDLREWDYGEDEGRTTAEIRVDRPGWTIWTQGPRGGETIDEVGARADRVVARVRAASGDVLCFAHGHVLRIVAARWLGLPPRDGSLLALDPATISILGWEHETPVIERWNQPLDG